MREPAKIKCGGVVKNCCMNNNTKGQSDCTQRHSTVSDCCPYEPKSYDIRLHLL